MTRYCCCAVTTTTGPLGQPQTFVQKCLPAAMDLGHCADSDHAQEGGTVPPYCCKADQ